LLVHRPGGWERNWDRLAGFAAFVCAILFHPSRVLGTLTGPAPIDASRIGVDIGALVLGSRATLRAAGAARRHAVDVHPQMISLLNIFFGAGTLVFTFALIGPLTAERVFVPLALVIKKFRGDGFIKLLQPLNILSLFKQIVYCLTRACVANRATRLGAPLHHVVWVHGTLADCSTGSCGSRFVLHLHPTVNLSQISRN